MDEQLTWDDLSKREQQYLTHAYQQRTFTHHKDSKTVVSLIEKGLLSGTGLVSGRYVTRSITDYGRRLCESETYAT
jgi:hypothetical protein